MLITLTGSILQELGLFLITIAHNKRGIVMQMASIKSKFLMFS